MPRVKNETGYVTHTGSDIGIRFYKLLHIQLFHSPFPLRRHIPCIPTTWLLSFSETLSLCTYMSSLHEPLCNPRWSFHFIEILLYFWSSLEVKKKLISEGIPLAENMSQIFDFHYYISRVHSQLAAFKIPKQDQIQTISETQVEFVFVSVHLRDVSPFTFLFTDER